MANDAVQSLLRPHLHVNESCLLRKARQRQLEAQQVALDPVKLEHDLPGLVHLAKVKRPIRKASEKRCADGQLVYWTRVSRN